MKLYYNIAKMSDTKLEIKSPKKNLKLSNSKVTKNWSCCQCVFILQQLSGHVSRCKMITHLLIYIFIELVIALFLRVR